MTRQDAFDSPRVDALIDVFRRADGRMADLPVYRRGLSIEARGFRPFEGTLIGVLITPWCMNLMMLPGDGMDWSRIPQGTEVDHALPCGTVRFVTARDDVAGDYRMCSLFSPMREFADMDLARATADAALNDVLTPPEAPVKGVSRRGLLRFGT